MLCDDATNNNKYRFGGQIEVVDCKLAGEPLIKDDANGNNEEASPPLNLTVKIVAPQTVNNTLDDSYIELIANEFGKEAKVKQKIKGEARRHKETKEWKPRYEP